MNQSVIIINIKPLFEILNEINDNFSFKLNYFDINEFEKNYYSQNKNLDNTIFLSNAEDSIKLNQIGIEKNKLILINFTPENVYKLIDKINVALMQNKYDFQSNIKIKNYSLDINVKTISFNNKKLKLTEKEIEIILFLNKNKLPKKVIELQKNVWGYSSDIETHTVETHVYRLRKKISDIFRDDKFILSNDSGYFL
tara:strand:- start:346 stop:936 length:591 start_codon:yes stop_codon:yes gene_type:complete